MTEDVVETVFPYGLSVSFKAFKETFPDITLF